MNLRVDISIQADLSAQQLKEELDAAVQDIVEHAVKADSAQISIIMTRRAIERGDDRVGTWSFQRWP